MTTKWLVVYVLFLGFVSQNCQSACMISVQPVLFGDYNTFELYRLDGVGSIEVTCDNPTDTYSLAISSGLGGFAERKMTFGVYTLAYNLYTDVARTSIWGDGSSGTSIVNGSGVFTDIAIYGRLPALQNVSVGNYFDNLIVTLNF